MSEERLGRFFVKESGGFRVRRDLLEMVLFATHDLLKDAPFSRMDLVSCRNLLIYLKRDAQRRALEIFQFALKPRALLFLGSSDSIDEGASLFATVDKKRRIYRQTPRLRVPMPAASDLQRALHHHERLNHKFIGLPGAAFVTDITERKQVEDALRESEERLRLVMENAREYAIFSMDLNRRITTWNTGAQSMMGYSPGEAIGKSGDIIFTSEDRAAGAPDHEAATALSQDRATDERWHLRKDGSRYWGSGVMTAMRDAQGQAIGLLKIFRDGTAAREARQALEASLRETERARAEAEAAGMAKDRFLAVLSHELRTPLMPVLMAVDFLALSKDLTPDVRETLEMIQRNVELESHFIDDLLDVTRIGHGNFEIMRQPLDLHEVIRRAITVTEPDLRAKNQQLEVELQAAEHRLDGDLARLQQVVWNLLKNASKFAPEGGAIGVRTLNEDGVVIIGVTDNGIGIAAEALSRIFDAFSQADEMITRQYGGLGLGLAIAKGTVDAHGGELRAKSPGLGKGATFSVILPLTPAGTPS